MRIKKKTIIMDYDHRSHTQQYLTSNNNRTHSIILGIIINRKQIFKKKQNKNKVDNFLKRMKKRTKINITSNTQFPPLQQQVNKNINNNSQDQASGEDESLSKLDHKKRSDYESEINKEQNQQQNKNKNKNTTKDANMKHKLNLIRQKIIETNNVKVQRKAIDKKTVNNTIFNKD